MAYSTSLSVRDDTAKDDAEYIRENIKKIELYYSVAQDAIYRARNIKTFLYVDPWDQAVRRNRENMSKPTLSFNKMVPMLRGILGEQRDNTPDLAVRDITTNFKVPQQQIDDLTDLLREISFSSNADMIYQLVFKQMMEGGWGTARVCIKYAEPTGVDNAVYSFAQQLYIEAIVDPACAFWDPTAQKSDKSDGDYCGVYTLMSRDKFDREYKDLKIENPESLFPADDTYYLPWTQNDVVVICEIYHKEYFTKKICELSNGKTLEEKDANEFMKLQEQVLAEKPHLKLLGYQEITITNRRIVRDYKIKHCKFIQNEILEKIEYQGKILPIPYAEGDSAVIDGWSVPLPYVAEAIDTQKMINYTGSEIAYAILRSRKETVIGTDLMFEDNPDDWRNPDQVQGALTYKVDSSAPGQKPEFITPPMFNPALMDAYRQSSSDLQTVTGRYDEANGQETNAISGSAIAKRQNAASKPVKVYTDNLARFIRQIGLIIMDLVPHIYDTERSVVVRGADGNTRKATFNQRAGMRYNAMGEMEDVKKNDVTQGQYDIEVRVDGSFDEQRAKALDFLIRFAAAYPAVAPLIPDEVVKNSGLESTSKLVKRMETLLPPPILAQEKGLPPPPAPPPPPPPPEIIIAQMKMKTDMGDQKLKQMEIAQKAAEIQIKAQMQPAEYQAAYAKQLAEMTRAHAEIIKSNNSVKEAALDHVTTTTKAQADFASNLLNAQTKRAALDAQSQQLKDMHI